MITDLVNRTIEIGQRKKCFAKIHVSEVVCVNAFKFDDGGIICVGLNNESRPIDSICCCISKNGDSCSSAAVMSPYEAMKQVRDLASVVGVCSLIESNGLEKSAKSMIGYGFEERECMNKEKCTPLITNLSPQGGYECVGVRSESQIRICDESDLGDHIRTDLTVWEATLLVSLLTEAIVMFMEDDSNIELIHNHNGYRTMEDVLRGRG